MSMSTITLQCQDKDDQAQSKVKLFSIRCVNVACVGTQSTSMSHETPSIRMRFQTQFFCYGYGHRPHVYDENDDRKRNVLKTLSRVDFFENDTVAHSVWMPENGTFR